MKRSQTIAAQTFELAEPLFLDVQGALVRFDGALEAAAERYAEMTNDKYADIKRALAPLVVDKRAQIKHRFDDLRRAHAARKRELRSFSLMFFGKTMAGKSTTIEALTSGDGATIGAGGPDFTRGIEGRSWEGHDLVLIDTPGLLGFRGELRGLAESYVDRADLICMVVSDDSIEPLLFQRMKEVRGQNKHLVVLLNVKAANNPILRREAEDAFDPREIGELVTFIRQRLNEVFPDEPADVIPYCANAAFEAHKAEDKEYSEYLWRESKIDDVIAYLVGTIERRGVPIRATAAFDSLAHYAQSISESLSDELPSLARQRHELQRKVSEAVSLFNRLERDSIADLGRLKSHFIAVNDVLHELAWEHARGDRKESPVSSFKRACRLDELDDLVSELQKTAFTRCQRNIEQFRDSLGGDLAAALALGNEDDFEGVELGGLDFDSGALKRKLGKLGRVVGAPAATLAGVYAGGAVGAAVGTFILPIVGTFFGELIGGFIGGWAAKEATEKLSSMIEESGVEDQRHVQRDLREALKERLWKLHDEHYARLRTLFAKLIGAARDAVVMLLKEYIAALDSITKQGDILIGDLHAARHALACRSFDTLLREVHPAFRDGKARLVDATQWMQYRAKILVTGRDGHAITGLVIGSRGDMIRAVRAHTGNPIDIVEVDGEQLTAKMVADALKPAHVAPAAVRLGSEVFVDIVQRGYGAALGPRKRNLLLAQELLGKPIKLRAITSERGNRR